MTNHFNVYGNYSFSVIVSEGYKAPFAAIIKSGECHVLRQVEVLNKLKNGQQVSWSKVVCLSNFTKKTDYFWEGRRDMKVVLQYIF